MPWYPFRPYVPVAQRRRNAQAAAKKIVSQTGRALEPVELSGRTIASTFWGKAWCDNLEAYSDYSNRLPRGRTYVRNGSVIDLQISQAKADALVQGSSLYRVTIQFKALPETRWKEFKESCAGKVTNLLDLLQGRLSKDILASIATPGTGLFPSPKEIDLACSCPDWASMCKHVAAVLYGIGARLDQKPELFFTLRGMDMQELLTAASASAVVPSGGPADGTLADSSLSEIFGIEIETSPAAAPVPQSKPLGQVRSRAKAKGKGRAKAAIPSRLRSPAAKGKLAMASLAAARLAEARAATAKIIAARDAAAKRVSAKTSQPQPETAQKPKLAQPAPAPAKPAKARVVFRGKKPSPASPSRAVKKTAAARKNASAGKPSGKGKK